MITEMTRSGLLPLAEASDPALHGGKAAPLATLATAGLPVPDALVLPAYADGLDEAAHALAGWAATSGVQTLVCRSSAPGEDGADHSFAGLFATVFTPANPIQIHTALEQVRTSATAPRVVAYATTNNLPVPDRIAVLIQAALRPRAAGVLFTNINLRDGRIWETQLDAWRVEAVHGLGVPLVNGTATAEIHLPARPAIPGVQPLLLLPATHAEMLLPPGEWTAPGTRPELSSLKVATSGNGLLALRLPATPPPVLTPPDVDALLALALATARVLALEHLDAEWAISHDGTIHLLQARPLTRPIPTNTPTTGATDAWRGQIAAAGQASGRAIAFTPDLPPNHVNDTILLCANIGPEAADAIVHSRPAALATTNGGALAHAAIVARELGIPCVTALPEQVIAALDGHHVDLDGDTGTLRRTTSPLSARTGDPADSHPAAELLTSPEAHAELPADCYAAIITRRTDLPQLAATLAPTRPQGILLLDPPDAPPPPGYTALHIGQYCLLLWPTSLPAPSCLTISDGDTVLWSRPLPAEGERAVNGSCYDDQGADQI